MPPKNRCVTERRTTKATTPTTTDRQCLLFFPLEGSHGIWPARLIRSKGRFGFEAKYGKQWFECRIEKEGVLIHFFIIAIAVPRFLETMDECQAAQNLLEKARSEKQWLSTETELSDNDNSGSDLSYQAIIFCLMSTHIL